MKEEQEKLEKLQETTEEFMKSLLEEANSHHNEASAKLLKEVIEDRNPNNMSAIKSNKPKVKKVVEEIEEDYNEEIDEDDDDFIVPDDEPFDLVPIPSKGLVYKGVKDKIPVAYLTASDEDLITSPNLYLDGKVIDLLLRKKILDKNIKPNQLCKGDRDAIIVWLRASGYGSQFPVTVKDPQSGENFETEVDLSQIKLNDFKLTPDKNGLFDFVLPKTGHLVKFRFMTYADEKNYSKVLSKSNAKVKIHILSEAKTNLSDIIANDDKLDIKLKENLKQAVVNLDTYIESIDDDKEVYVKSVTYILEKCIVSIDGESNKSFIKKYITTMPAFDSMALRKFITNNAPSLDYTVTVQRPESLGGGSFNTFLELDSTIFINIA